MGLFFAQTIKRTLNRSSLTNFVTITRFYVEHTPQGAGEQTGQTCVKPVIRGTL